MNLADIKARHAHIESQERTQSIELLSERRSKSHKDRAWLIAELESARVENERLQGELDRLSVAVAEVKSGLEFPVFDQSVKVDQKTVWFSNDDGSVTVVGVGDAEEPPKPSQKKVAKKAKAKGVKRAKAKSAKT